MHWHYSAHSKSAAIFTASLLYLFGVACADAAAAQDAVVETSTVVFVRPSGFGWDHSTSVFDVVNDRPALKGIMQAETRLEVQVPAGSHTFMVLCKGNNPNFLSAQLAAGKTYFVTVSLQRRFSGPASCHLEAERNASKNAKKAEKWISNLKPVEMNAEASRWESDNAPSIKERFGASYATWAEQHKSEPPMLSEGDGK